MHRALIDVDHTSLPCVPVANIDYHCLSLPPSDISVRDLAYPRRAGTTIDKQHDRKFDGFQLGSGNVQVDDTLLLIEPEAARQYEASQSKEVSAAGAEGQVETPPAATDGAGASGVFRNWPTPIRMAQTRVFRSDKKGQAANYVSRLAPVGATR
jgi:hypothetical protein